MSRYEDKTQENILNDSLAKANNLMSELPEEERVSMDEGSLIYLALSKNALRLEEAYAELDALNDNLLVDTQDEEHLIETGAEAGLPIISGTPANVRAELNCEAEEGTEFSAVDSDYNYILTEFIETIIDGENTRYAYVLEAMDDGVAPGNYRGDIEPVDFLDGFDTGEIVSTIDPGTEQEDIEVYLYVAEFDTGYFGDNLSCFISRQHPSISDNFEADADCGKYYGGDAKSHPGQVIADYNTVYSPDGCVAKIPENKGCRYLHEVFCFEFLSEHGNLGEDENYVHHPCEGPDADSCPSKVENCRRTRYWSRPEI